MSTKSRTTRTSRLKRKKRRIGIVSPAIANLAKKVLRVKLRRNGAKETLKTFFYQEDFPTALYRINSGDTKAFYSKHSGGNKIFIKTLGSNNATGKNENLQAIIHKYGSENFEVNKIVINSDKDTDHQNIIDQIKSIDPNLEAKIKFHREDELKHEMRTKEILGKIFENKWGSSVANFPKDIYSALGTENNQNNSYSNSPIALHEFDDARMTAQTFFSEKVQPIFKRELKKIGTTAEALKLKIKNAQTEREQDLFIDQYNDALSKARQEVEPQKIQFNKDKFETEGAYFHFRNDKNKNSSNERIILNIKTQVQALGLSKFLADRIEAANDADWTDNISSFKFLANKNSEGPFIKNDKAVIYLNNDLNNLNRDAIINGLNTYLDQNGGARNFLNENLSAFYKVIQPGIGVGKEIPETSFTIERSNELAAFVANKNADDFGNGDGSKKEFVDAVHDHLKGLTPNV